MSQKSLAEQLLAIKPEMKLTPPVASKPRCMCHNKYECPGQSKPKVVKPKLYPFTAPPRRVRKCSKQGHLSQGAAEAALRSIQRLNEVRGEWKKEYTLNTYRCRRPECQEKPWHVGHKHPTAML